MRAILDKVEYITIPSHPASPIIHIHIRNSSGAPATLASSPSQSSPKPSNPFSVLPRDPQQFDVDLEEKLLQDVVEEALQQNVLLTRARRLRGQELVEVRPSVRLAITAALSRKDCEKAANTVKAALIKVLGKRR